MKDFYFMKESSECVPICPFNYAFDQNGICVKILECPKNRVLGNNLLYGF